MTHDPTFWLLARASGITAYVLVTLSVLAGLVLKSRPFARLRPATVTNVHRALGCVGTTCRRRFACARHDGEGFAARTLCSGLGELSPGRDEHRRSRRRTDSRRLRVILAASTDWKQSVARTPLGDVRDLRSRNRPRTRGRHRFEPALGRPCTSAPSAWSSSRPRGCTVPKGERHGRTVSSSTGSLCRLRIRADSPRTCDRAGQAPKAMLRVGETDDDAVLAARPSARWARSRW